MKFLVGAFFVALAQALPFDDLPPLPGFASTAQDSPLAIGRIFKGAVNFADGGIGKMTRFGGFFPPFPNRNTKNGFQTTVYPTAGLQPAAEPNPA